VIKTRLCAVRDTSAAFKTRWLVALRTRVCGSGQLAVVVVDGWRVGEELQLKRGVFRVGGGLDKQRISGMWCGGWPINQSPRGRQLNLLTLSRDPVSFGDGVDVVES